MTVDAVSGLVQWLPSQEDLGSVNVGVLIDDNAGESSLHQYLVTVQNTNDPPTISAVRDSAAIEDLQFQLALVAADPDPDDSLSFQVIAGPAGLTVDQTGIVLWVPSQQDVGVHEVSIEVSDESGSSATGRFALEVIEVDDPPTITSQPDSLVAEDDTFTYLVAAEDEEEGEVTYSLATAPAGMTVDTTGEVSWTPDNEDVGVHSIELGAQDPGGNRASQFFDLRVQGVDDPPVIAARIPDVDLVIAAPDQELTLTVEALDEEGVELSYSWSRNGTLVEGAAAAELSVIPSTTDVDVLVVDVSDGENAVSAQWTIDARQIPRFSVSPSAADFGSLAIGETGQVTAEIGNVGAEDLVIAGLQIGDLQFSALFSASSIAPNAVAGLELRFTPQFRGETASSISFTTNDPNHPTVQIPMVGTGIVPTRFALDLDPGPGLQGRVDTMIAAGQTLELALYGERAIDLVGYDLTLAFEPDQFTFSRFDTAGDIEENLLAAPGVALLAGASLVGEGLLGIGVSAQDGAAGVSATVCSASPRFWRTKALPG